MKKQGRDEMECPLECLFMFFTKRLLSFSKEAMAEWSNLYMWNNDGLTDVTIGDGKVSLTFLGYKDSIHPQFLVSLPPCVVTNVGSYVSSSSRKVTDPVDLAVLMSSSCVGSWKSVVLELMSAFPVCAQPRIEIAIDFVSALRG